MPRNKLLRKRFKREMYGKMRVKQETEEEQGSTTVWRKTIHV